MNGFDVSKDRLDVHLCPSGQAFAIARDSKGLEQLVSDLRALAPALIVLEATGGFELTVAAALAGAGLPLAVVNPRQIRDFARATGRLAKTDALDAQIIALFAERIRPEPRPLADADSQPLAELVARRRQVIEMIGMESNRLHQARDRRIQRTIKATLKTLEAQLAQLDREINDTVKGSPAWRAADDLLTSVPGVGNITSFTLIADLPELGQLDRHRRWCISDRQRLTGKWARTVPDLLFGRFTADTTSGELAPTARARSTIGAKRDTMRA
jgi:transposase